MLCLGILNGNDVQTLRIAHTLARIQCLFAEPNREDPLNMDECCRDVDEGWGNGSQFDLCFASCRSVLENHIQKE